MVESKITLARLTSNKIFNAKYSAKALLVDFLLFFFLLFAIALPILFEAGYSRQLIMLFLTILLFILTLRKNLNFYFSSIVINCLLLLFLVDFISSIILNVNFLSHAFNDFISIFITLSLFSYIKQRGTVHFSKIAVGPFLLGGPIVGFYQFFSKSFIYTGGTEGEMQSADVLTNAMHSNTNYAALTMLISFAITLYLFLVSKKVSVLILHLISIVSVVLTYSRTAIALMVVVVFYLVFLSGLLFKTKKHKRIMLFLLVATVVVVAFNFNMILSYINSDTVQQILSNKKTSEISLRVNQWAAAWKSTVLSNSLTHFLFGHGDNSAEAMKVYSGYEMSAHNFIFGQLVGSGFPAFIISCFMYLIIIIKAVALFRTRFKIEYSFLLGCLTIVFAYFMLSIITYELIVCIAIIGSLLDNKGFAYEARKNRLSA